MVKKLDTKKNIQLIKIFILFFLFFLLLISQNVLAQTQNLILEYEHHWDTYEIGGTCNFGTYNFFVGDIDNDETLELITGGMSYDMLNSSRTELRAPFKIWNWNGERFSLEKSHEWLGVTRSTFATDLDLDGLPEIITGGTKSDGTNINSILRVWNWDGTNLLLKSEYEGISSGSISAYDFDEDGVSEIIVA